MVIDCFTFYNELKMLLFRLEYLWDTVDYFVIVEATVTQMGHPKPLYFGDNSTMFEKYMSKIVRVVVDDMPQGPDPWVRERFQRNCIDRGIQRLSLSDDDLIIISDADEIPNKHTLRKLTISDGLHGLEQHLFYYNFSGRFENVVWRHAKILKYKTYVEKGRLPDNMRMNFSPVSWIANGGWHFSYFGSPEFIANKIKNCSHQEYNSPEYTDIDKITKRIQNRQELFCRDNNLVDTDVSLLPENYEMLIDM